MGLFRLAAYFTLFALLQACTSKGLIPITEQATGHSQQGQVIWHDCITDDLEKNIRFYSELLGWSFEDHDGYTVILNSGQPIAGMVESTAAENTEAIGGWISYISMKDVPETADWVSQAGGEILRGPSEMPNRGQYAMISGPQGAPLIILNSINGDPLPEPPPLGGWLWLELWTSDIEKALEFYQALGEYSAVKTSEDEAEEYWVLIDSENRWQAGITVTPFEEIPSLWVPVIRVENPAEIVEKVEGLGGKVIIKPNHPLTNGKVALIQDPTGGIFMVESWQKTKTEQEQ